MEIKNETVEEKDWDRDGNKKLGKMSAHKEGGWGGILGREINGEAWFLDNPYKNGNVKGRR
jgi:hypothetical protein